jgi:DNA-directed RNA polymerase omega subunit
MLVMDETGLPSEDQFEDLDGVPAIPAEPAPPIQSRFLFVDVAALRAKQLRRGARVRFDREQFQAHKPERVAMEEVRRGLVLYDIPVKGGRRPEETA